MDIYISGTVGRSLNGLKPLKSSSDEIFSATNSKKTVMKSIENVEKDEKVLKSSLQKTSRPWLGGDPPLPTSERQSAPSCVQPRWQAFSTEVDRSTSRPKASSACCQCVLRQLRPIDELLESLRCLLDPLLLDAS